MEDLLICSDCIKNQRLLNWINRVGHYGKCGIDDAHGNKKVILASDFALEVDDWFRENYVPGDYDYRVTGNPDKPSYEQGGSYYSEIMCEELGCDDSVFEAFERYLPDASHRDIARGAETFYDQAASYENIADIQARRNAEEEQYWYETRFSLQWRDFCENVIYQKRFFGAREQLDALFGDPAEFEKGKICPLYNITEGQIIHRARLLDNTSVVEKVQSSPASELGAPPKELTRSGRMNVEFIPAFYGAFSQKTAVAEIRPGLGEVIAIGRFKLIRSIRVFDFTAFDIKDDVDRVETLNHTRYDFLDQMEGEISKPVHPSDRQREYIPTQVAAEYLGEVFGCDAVIYRSSMVGNGSDEARNIVFLNKGHPHLDHALSPLKFISYELFEVGDVKYRLDSYMPF